MRLFLLISAVGELTIGVALMTVPEMLVTILVGAPLETHGGVFVARLAGAALLALGIICLLGSLDTGSRAARGIAVGMLFYNVAAAGLLIFARFGAEMSGVGLLPAAVIHVVLAVFCVICVRSSLTGSAVQK